MKYILIGKIVNTHGLKGEIRILSKFRYIKNVMIPNMKIYIGKNKVEETINTYRHHKMFEMITMHNYHDINEVLKYKGEYVFVNKDDIPLGKNEYLDEDIIGLNVYINEEYKGIIKNIEDHNKNLILVIKNESKTFLIPYNFDIIKSVDLPNKKIYINEIVGLLD